jgi:hypothetical protein
VDGIQRFNRHIFLNKLFGPIQDRRTDFYQLPPYNHSAIRIFGSMAARPAPPSTEPISAYSAERSILSTNAHTSRDASALASPPDPQRAAQSDYAAPRARAPRAHCLAQLAGLPQSRANQKTLKVDCLWYYVSHTTRRRTLRCTRDAENR